jgi:hypothetical protein
VAHGTPPKKKRCPHMNKRTILTAGLAAAAGLFAYFNFSKTQKGGTETKAQPLAASTGNAFSSAALATLQGYYQLKDAFVKTDTNLVNAAATRFLPLVAALPTDSIEADTALVQMASEFKQTMMAQAQAILVTPDIERKRSSFQPLSDALFDLLRTTKYHQTKVYQQYCPMAFDNAGAAWLSNSHDIVNPYFGDEMLHCGELRDSIRQ